MPTFAISPNPRLSCDRLPVAEGGRQQGFTLIELMVVLAIGAMIVGLVPVAFSKLNEGSQYRDAVRNVVTDLRQARQNAVALGQTVVFQVDVNQRQFGIEGKPQKLLPKSLEIKTIVGQLGSMPANGLARIAFLPEGGSTGGSIELVRSSGAGIRIRVDWLLGQVTQEPRIP
jgi:general secretion pathway protein H